MTLAGSYMDAFHAFAIEAKIIANSAYNAALANTDSTTESKEVTHQTITKITEMAAEILELMKVPGVEEAFVAVSLRQYHGE